MALAGCSPSREALPLLADLPFPAVIWQAAMASRETAAVAAAGPWAPACSPTGLRLFRYMMWKSTITPSLAAMEAAMEEQTTVLTDPPAAPAKAAAVALWRKLAMDSMGRPVGPPVPTPPAAVVAAVRAKVRLTLVATVPS